MVTPYTVCPVTNSPVTTTTPLFAALRCGAQRRADGHVVVVVATPPLLRRRPPGAPRLRAVQILRHHPAGNLTTTCLHAPETANAHTRSHVRRARLPAYACNAGGRADRRQPAAAEDGGRAVRKLLRHPLRRAAARRAAGAGVRRAASPDAGSHRALPCPPFALARVLAHWPNDDRRVPFDETGGRRR